jgi:hypothetical protein
MFHWAYFSHLFRGKALETGSDKLKSKIRWIGQNPVAFWSMMFLFVRLLFLFANDGYIFDVGDTGVRFQEEFNVTDVAHELARGNGRIFDGIALAPGSIFGGELIQALLYTTLFKLVGQSYYAVKLLPITFSFLILLTLLHLANYAAGKRAAHLLGALTLFGFPTFLLSNFYGLGNHMELALVICLGLFSITVLLTQYARKKNLLLFFLCGLLTGFGLFYNLLALIFIFWLAPFLAAAIYKYGKRKIAFALTGAVLVVIGFFIGLSPYFMLRNNLSVPMAIDASLLGTIREHTQMGLPGFEKRPLSMNMTFLSLDTDRQITPKGIWIFASYYSHAMFGFANAANMIFRFVVLFLSVLSLPLLFSSRPPPRLRLAAFASLSYIGAHFLVIAGTNILHNGMAPDAFVMYRYLFPVFPLLIFWCAIAAELSFFHKRSIVRAFSFSLFAILIVLGLFGFFQRFKPASFMKYKNLPGYSYEAITISVWDYFSQYRGTPKQQCNQAAIYLSTCDPNHKDTIYYSLSNSCAKEHLELLYQGNQIPPHQRSNPENPEAASTTEDPIN